MAATINERHVLVGVVLLGQRSKSGLDHLQGRLRADIEHGRGIIGCPTPGRCAPVPPERMVPQPTQLRPQAGILMLEALACGVEPAHTILKLLRRPLLVPEEPLIGNFEVIGRGGGQPVRHRPAGEVQRPTGPLDAPVERP
jgi:hypothetical protein